MPRRSGQQPPAGSSTGTINAPAFLGRVDNTIEALRLVRAAQLGLVPRIQRRLNVEERETMVVSGAVFVFNVDEAAMKRWTDGKIWSPSRIDGNFLVYRELNEKKEVVVVSDRFEVWSPGDDVGAAGSRSKARSSRTPTSAPSPTPEAVSASSSFKSGGLSKKTITVKISNIDHHLVAYFTQEDIDDDKLSTVSSRADIMSAPMPADIFHFAEFRLPPRVLQSTGGEPPMIVCEPETIGTGVLQELAEPLPEDRHYSGTTIPAESMLSMDLAWPADQQHEHSQSIEGSVHAHGYPIAPVSASYAGSSHEGRQDTRWLPSTPGDLHEQHQPRSYQEQWLSPGYAHSGAIDAMPLRSYSYPLQSTLHPLSSDRQVDVETHEGGHGESLWHGRDVQAGQQYWNNNLNRSSDSESFVFPATAYEFPNMLHSLGQLDDTSTSPNPHYDFPQEDEFYGRKNHER